MVWVTEAELRKEADAYRNAEWTRLAKSAGQVLAEATRTSATSFDVFLSHSMKDEKVILGLYLRLKSMGSSVYVDWIVDPQLDRSKISSDTAERLRTRMRQSKTLIYAHSVNASDSKWMPWELGYFDGFRSAVAVLPIATTGKETAVGQEYLGLYPQIDVSGATMFVNKGSASDRLYGQPGAHSGFKPLRSWIVEKAA